MIKLLFRIMFLFTVALFVSCRTDVSDQPFSYPKPIKVFVGNGVAINSYDFKSFEPYLNFKNDTTYVLNFWATWCEPCVAELPNFEKLNTVYKDKNVKVILVSLDMSKKFESTLLPFIARKDLKTEIVILNDANANEWIDQVSSEWSGAIPATLIYNKNKRHLYEQSFTFESLEKAVIKLNQ